MTQVIEKTFTRSYDFGPKAQLSLRWASLDRSGVTAHLEASLAGKPLECGRIKLHSPSNRGGFVVAVRRRLPYAARQADLDPDVEGHAARLHERLVEMANTLYGELAG